MQILPITTASIVLEIMRQGHSLLLNGTSPEYVSEVAAMKHLLKLALS